jgi:hypothetical protein
MQDVLAINSLRTFPFLHDLCKKMLQLPVTNAQLFFKEKSFYSGKNTPFDTPFYFN